MSQIHLRHRDNFEMYLRRLETSQKRLMPGGVRLGLSHFRQHKFKHSFQDTLNPVCNCGQDIETPCHYLLSCPNYDVERNALLNNIRQIAPNILNHNDSQITQILLFGDASFNSETNTSILNTTINYFLSTKRFSDPIFLSQ